MSCLSAVSPCSSQMNSIEMPSSEVVSDVALKVKIDAIGTTVDVIKENYDETHKYMTFAANHENELPNISGDP